MDGPHDSFFDSQILSKHRPTKESYSLSEELQVSDFNQIVVFGNHGSLTAFVGTDENTPINVRAG